MYKNVYKDLKAVSGRMVLKAAPLPEDIIKLGAEGVNRIWRVMDFPKLCILSY